MTGSTLAQTSQEVTPYYRHIGPKWIVAQSRTTAYHGGLVCKAMVTQHDQDVAMVIQHQTDQGGTFVQLVDLDWDLRNTPTLMPILLNFDNGIRQKKTGMILDGEIMFNEGVSGSALLGFLLEHRKVVNISFPKGESTPWNIHLNAYARDGFTAVSMYQRCAARADAITTTALDRRHRDSSTK